jgi:nicotinate-nucleotide--dimethylbenzimidazole phosphoribosyltransferase
VRALEEWIEAIVPPDGEAAEEARRLLDEKTKPPGSLGRVEELAVRLAGIYGRVDFETHPRTVAIFAADHGVALRGVSAYPREVTAQMVRNFAAGGAAINVLARLAAVRTIVVDVGVAAETDGPPGVRRARVAPGTADMTVGPAMSPAEARRAVEIGAEVGREAIEAGAKVLLTGEMGIGNSTAAAALAAVFTGRPVEEVTGRGTGVGDDAFARKVAAVRQALERNRPRAEDPLGALASVGGLEIGALAGFVLAGAASRVPVVLDGFIAGAAASVACGLAPRARDFLVAGHRSAEPGHAAVLERLGLVPLLDLGMRLGEGTGAVLALPILDAARAILAEMASFESAGVSRARPKPGPDPGEPL